IIRTFRKFIATTMALIFLCTMYNFGLLYVPSQSTNVAKAEEREISFTYSRDASLLYEYGGIMYSAASYMRTNTISIDAGAGKVIKEAVFRRGSRNVAKIDAAAGQKSWTGTQTIYGVSTSVSSKENTSSLGSWYSWDRYGLGSRGDGRVWYSDSVSEFSNGCSLGTPD